MSGVWRIALLLFCLVVIAPADALAEREFSLRWPVPPETGDRRATSRSSATR
jgi:hypothetical protein